MSFAQFWSPWRPCYPSSPRGCNKYSFLDSSVRMSRRMDGKGPSLLLVFSCLLHITYAVTKNPGQRPCTELATFSVPRTLWSKAVFLASKCMPMKQRKPTAVLVDSPPMSMFWRTDGRCYDVNITTNRASRQRQTDTLKPPDHLWLRLRRLRRWPARSLGDLYWPMCFLPSQFLTWWLPPSCRRCRSNQQISTRITRPPTCMWTTKPMIRFISRFSARLGPINAASGYMYVISSYEAQPLASSACSGLSIRTGHVAILFT